MLFNVFEPKLVDSLLYAMIEFFNHGTLRSQLSFEPHPFIRPPSRSRVYLCPFRGLHISTHYLITMVVLYPNRYTCIDIEMIDIAVSFIVIKIRNDYMRTSMSYDVKLSSYDYAIS